MSKPKPLITIGIPARNEGVWLHNTLSSIIKNTLYPNYEVIVLDDASIDGSCLNLEKEYPQLNLRVIRVLKNEPHGTAISRQRLLEASEGELFVTTDAHMVFPEGWLTGLYEIQCEYPESFIVAASTDMQSANSEIVATMNDTPDDDTVKNTINEWKEKYKDKPFYISRTWREDEGYAMQHVLTKYYGCSVVFHCKRIEKKDTPVTWQLHLVDDTINMDYPSMMYGAGTYLEYDTEGHNMIHPVWLPCYNVDYKPYVDVMPVDGMMGACYMFPKQLLLDRLGGWLPIEGWIEEEPWLSIAAKITGIQIYCATKIVVAHLYTRPMTQISNTNTKRKDLNSKIITEILFNEYKAKIQMAIFKTVVHPKEFKDYKQLIKSRRELIKKYRVMNDGDFLIRTGLIHYFDSNKKIEVSRRLSNGAELGIKKMGHEGLVHVMKEITENPGVVWNFHLMCIAERTGGAIKHFAVIEANDYDWQKGCRDHTPNGYNKQKRWEMTGRVHEYIGGFTAAHFLSEHFGLQLKPQKQQETQNKEK